MELQELERLVDVLASAFGGVEAAPLGGVRSRVVESGIEHLLPRTVASAPPEAPAPQPQNRESGSAAGSVLKTVALATGVGPVAAGLARLFGGGGEKREPQPEFARLRMPERVAIDAGVDAQGRVVPVDRGQGGTLRTIESQAPTQVTVNVQAIDSRSFLDYSDEIARAVREAMLHAHSLNDVVAEV